MRIDRECAARKFSSLSLRFNISFYIMASIQTLCTILCTIIYTSKNNPIFGSYTRTFGLIVSFTASILSSFLLIFPLKNIYSDCDKASKLLLFSPNKNLDPDVKQLINNINIPCVKNPLMDCIINDEKPKRIKIVS